METFEQYIIKGKKNQTKSTSDRFQMTQEVTNFDKDWVIRFTFSTEKKTRKKCCKLFQHNKRKIDKGKDDDPDLLCASTEYI